MRVRIPSLSVALIAVLGLGGCGGAPTVRSADRRPVREVVEPGVAAPSRPAGAAQPVVPFSTADASLTETLDSTLTVLEEVRKENARLKETNAQLQQQLQQREETISRLNEELDAGGSRIQQLEGALQKWQQDVLGFRDEMRRAEEAELGILQKILALLQEFEEQREIE